MEGAPNLEGANALEVLAFEEKAELRLRRFLTFPRRTM